MKIPQSELDEHIDLLDGLIDGQNDELGKQLAVIHDYLVHRRKVDVIRQIGYRFSDYEFSGTILDDAWIDSVCPRAKEYLTMDDISALQGEDENGIPYVEHAGNVIARQFIASMTVKESK